MKDPLRIIPAILATIALVVCVLLSVRIWKPRPARSLGNAVDLAMTLQEQEFRIEEEAEEVGAHCWLGELDNCIAITRRAKANPKLKEALLRASKKGVLIYVDEKFEVRSGAILVDLNARDEEIIQFLE